ncbi:hypothetical protein BHE74_00007455 [Ensete ventricosum]|nr:hypothetical protein GW17_00030963 [Ensete ventricosum]RWW83987.1 hypothetical protein BHE74_00007455 [Ensete ventricosum]RZS16802.1 hypothetical protein BHM03_00048851 [Ensete ventricosum]
MCLCLACVGVLTVQNGKCPQKTRLDSSGMGASRGNYECKVGAKEGIRYREWDSALRRGSYDLVDFLCPLIPFQWKKRSGHWGAPLSTLTVGVKALLLFRILINRGSMRIFVLVYY